MVSLIPQYIEVNGVASVITPTFSGASIEPRVSLQYASIGRYVKHFVLEGNFFSKSVEYPGFTLLNSVSILFLQLIKND